MSVQIRGGGGSTDEVSVGAVSKGLFCEHVASDGKLAGAAKTIVTYSAVNFTAAGTEGLVTLTPCKNFANLATGTTHIIPSGKRFVPIGISLFVKNAGAALQWCKVTLRCNPNGAVVASSPIVCSLGTGTPNATANTSVGITEIISNAWPSVIEFQGDGLLQIGISQIGTATAGNDVYLWGYEY